MMYRIFFRLRVLVSICTILAVGSQYALAETSAKPSVKRFWAEVNVFSIMPGKGIESIEGVFSGGGFGPGATWGTSIQQGERQIELRLHGQVKEGRFTVKLAVSEEVGEKKKVLPELTKNLDLTDMATKTIELAKDPGGRVYHLRLDPKVIESPVASQFDAKELRLEQFSFNNSTVILDDQEYLGTRSMFSGELVHVDISGVAKIEFSLLPFKGASEQGQLNDGTINIHHEGRSLHIQKVRNGAPASELQGGPYALYVRWSPPTYSAEESRQIQKRQLDDLRTQLNNGEGNVTEEKLKLLEQSAEKRRVFMSYGLSPISAKDK